MGFGAGLPVFTTDVLSCLRVNDFSTMDTMDTMDTLSNPLK